MGFLLICFCERAYRFVVRGPGILHFRFVLVLLRRPFCLSFQEWFLNLHEKAIYQQICRSLGVATDLLKIQFTNSYNCYIFSICCRIQGSEALQSYNLIILFMSFVAYLQIQNYDKRLRLIRMCKFEIGRSCNGI